VRVQEVAAGVDQKCNPHFLSGKWREVITLLNPITQERIAGWVVKATASTLLLVSRNLDAELLMLLN